MNTVLETILTEWHSSSIPTIIPRARSIPLRHDQQPRLAIVVTGFRRVGKTSLLFGAIHTLLRTYSKNQILYINFEDERLGLLQTSLLTDLIPTFQFIHGHKPKYIFLDELQLVPNWSKWVRRILDTEPDIELVITGSTSKMSSAELPTELRGRSLDFKVSPLSFAEFLHFKKFSPPSSLSLLSTDAQVVLARLFEEFLIYGGLPGVVLASISEKYPLLRTYYKTVIERDLLERYQLGSSAAIKMILKYLLDSPHFTISKIFNNLKSQGLAISKPTLITYLEYIENTYFSSPLYIYNRSFHNTLLYPRISYLIDTGFLTALSTTPHINYGRLFENAVYLELSRRHEKIYYYKNRNNQEIDFLIADEQANLIQACYDLSNLETLKRERTALAKCASDFPSSKQILISHIIPSLSLGPILNLTPSYEFFLSDKTSL